MSRKREDEPAFNQPRDTGRMGFRHEWEPVDDRPLIVYPYPFWESKIEQAIYEAAVAGNPRCEDEGPFSYIRRVAEIVTGERETGPKLMPRLGLSHRQRDARLMALREQGKGE